MRGLKPVKECRDILLRMFDIFPNLAKYTDPNSETPLNLFLADTLEQHDDVYLRPKCVRFDICTRCQLNCPLCIMRIENSINIGAGYTKAEDFERFCRENPFVRVISLANWGEAFLNPELREIIRIAARRGIQLDMSAGVNFNYAGEGVIEEIVRSGNVSKINVAIDGVTQEVYEKYRVNGNVEKVYDNIRQLNAFKKKYHTDLPKLEWQYILFSHNEEEAEAACAKAKELDMELHFKLDGAGEFQPRDRERLEKITGLKCFSRKEHAKKTGENYLNKICRQMVYAPQINYDGRLLGCCIARRYDWGINVFDGGLVKAVNHPAYRNTIIKLLRQESVAGDDTPCGHCSRFDRPVIDAANIPYGIALNHVNRKKSETDVGL